MPYILEPRPTSDAPVAHRCPQANGAGHFCKCATDCTATKPCAVLGDEECVILKTQAEFLAPFCILHKGSTCRVLYRDEAGLSELRLTDREDTVLEVHVGNFESVRLTRPKSGSRKETDERYIGHCAQPCRRGKSGGLGHETLYFLVGENVWLIASVTGMEEPLWWDLRSGVGRTNPSSESPHSSESSCPCRSLHTFRLTCPAEGEVSGDELSSYAIEKLYEVTKRHGRLSKLGAEGTANCDIMSEGITNGTHRAPPLPGQDRAIPRNASKSTFA